MSPLICASSATLKIITFQFILELCSFSAHDNWSQIRASSMRRGTTGYAPARLASAIKARFFGFSSFCEFLTHFLVSVCPTLQAVLHLPMPEELALFFDRMNGHRFSFLESIVDDMKCWVSHLIPCLCSWCNFKERFDLHSGPHVHKNSPSLSLSTTPPCSISGPSWTVPRQAILERLQALACSAAGTVQATAEQKHT